MLKLEFSDTKRGKNDCKRFRNNGKDRCKKL